MSSPPASTEDRDLRALSATRWRRAIVLTVLMLFVYFGFILLGAYAKDTMGAPLVPGLSLGILLGALVIVSAFVLTGVYVRWANAHYDPALAALRGRIAQAAGKSDPGQGGGK
jgi:uncharacterized membrane protein (DUF485 family)